MIPCPRLTHNIRLAEDGKFQVCGHMIDAPKFNTVGELRSSEWLQNSIRIFENDNYPIECKRCEQMEEIRATSIRQHSINVHMQYIEDNPNYLMVTGILDNICNSACLICSSLNSTYIGKLSSNVIVINNNQLFSNLDLKNILVLELTGGEPSVSSNYKKILRNLTEHTKYVRINTNGLKVIPELVPLLDKGVKVTITLSIDGVGEVFENLRWPIRWEEFKDTQRQYIDLAKTYKNLKLNYWMTVNALNINDIENVQLYSNSTGIPMSYALLEYPDELNVKYSNELTIAAKKMLDQSTNYELINLASCVAIDRNNANELDEFIQTQRKIRKIL